MVKAEESKDKPSIIYTLLAQKNMRIFNLAAIGLAVVAWIIRFYYFTAREDVEEREVTLADGTTVKRLETVELQDGFWLVIYTLIVFPLLFFVFVV